MTAPINHYEILLVEDSLLVSKVLEDWIHRYYGNGEKKTVLCSDAEQGLEYLKGKETSGENLPDLIILDLELPGQHGLEFLRNIKNHPRWKNIPVIVNSSSKKKEDILGAYKNGSLLFMQKGDNAEVFQELIQKLRIQGVLK